jgi:hypothetical protein
VGRGQGTVETDCKGGQGPPRTVAPSGWMDGSYYRETDGRLGSRLPPRCT